MNVKDNLIVDTKGNKYTIKQFAQGIMCGSFACTNISKLSNISWGKPVSQNDPSYAERLLQTYRCSNLMQVLNSRTSYIDVFCKEVKTSDSMISMTFWYTGGQAGDWSKLTNKTVKIVIYFKTGRVILSLEGKHFSKDDSQDKIYKVAPVTYKIPDLEPNTIGKLINRFLDEHDEQQYT